MASVIKKGNGYYISVSIDGIPWKVYGFTNQRIAKQTGEKIDSLIMSKKTGFLPDETRLWLKKVEETPLYKKLAKKSWWNR